MNEMFKISFTGDSDRLLVQKLEQKGPTIIQVLASKLQALMIQLQSYVVSRKLRGEVLHYRSGTLADSVVAVPLRTEGTLLIGAVEGGGGAAFYGKIHELGGVFTVKDRALKFASSKTRAGFMFHNVVRKNQIVFPPRPFMGPSLTENAENIQAELRAVLNEEISK